MTGRSDIGADTNPYNLTRHSSVWRILQQL